MEQIRVSDLASEFELKHTLVIAELKKIGVWVPSADTPVDQDIANRIRRRLQLIAEVEQDQQSSQKAKTTVKSAAPARPRKVSRKTIKELGTTRRARKQPEPETPAPSPVSMKPRKGKSSYRVVQAEPVPPERVEVSIDDEPVIEKVEAQLSAEALETLQPSFEEQAAAVESSLGTIEVPAEPEVTETAVEEVGEPVSEVAESAATAGETAGAIEEPARHDEPTTAAEPGQEEAPVPQEVRRRPLLAQPPRKLKIIRRPERKVQPGPISPALPEQKPGKPAVSLRPPAEAPQVPVAAGKVREAKPQAPRPSEVVLAETVTIKELGDKINVKGKDILRWLLNRGLIATINQRLEQQLVEEVCLAFDVIPSFVSFEESVTEEERFEEKKEDLVERAPVVTVMGHVDHGKTSLLDRIRHTRVAAGEAGGITQHIGAYHVKAKGKRIVFIDTPGHEAFTRMRARGAEATDIVVLVVAADDGVMPQTREAINHARAAQVPIIVAINKIDRADANPDKVRRELSELELVSEDWGGDTIMVEVSAVEGTNLETLLEMILLVAELQELKANPKRPASGVILEARLDKGRGAVATVLVQNGTLAVGDSFISGSCLGKIRALFDDRGKPVKKVGPASAVEILGLQGMPQAGDSFQVVEDLPQARQIAEYRSEKEKEQDRVQTAKVSLDQLYAQLEAGEVKELPIVLKADAQGSAEVLADMLVRLSTDRVKIKIIHRGIGAISETDILLASASNAVVIGFNVRPEQNAQSTAEKEGVDVRLYTVIYEISKEIKEAMVGLLEPTLREAFQGRAEVRDIFQVPKFGTVGGCYVQEGVIKRNSEARLLRDNVVVFEGRIDSLRRFKDDVNQVRSGYECGIALANFRDLKPGDIIEVFTTEEVAPELA